MDLRLPLHVIARRHGLVVSACNLEAALTRGWRPILYRAGGGPRATILRGGGSFTSDAPCMAPSWSQGWGSAFSCLARPVTRLGGRAGRDECSGLPGARASSDRGRGVAGSGEQGEHA